MPAHYFTWFLPLPLARTVLRCLDTGDLEGVDTPLGLNVYSPFALFDSSVGGPRSILFLPVTDEAIRAWMRRTTRLPLSSSVLRFPALLGRGSAALLVGDPSDCFFEGAITCS